MSQPLFTIITPTFNSGAKTAFTVSSVLSQDFTSYEYLVIDGCSTDDTLDQLPTDDARLRWWSEPDRGIYDAMNKGIRLARGRYLYFLGAGDRLCPGVLREMAAFLSVDGDTRHFLYGDVHWSGGVGRYGGAFDAMRLAYSNINHQAIFYGREVFKLVGNYDLRYKTCADYALNICCLGHSAIRKQHVDLIVADFEGGGASEGTDEAFFGDVTTIVRQQLGLKAGLAAIYYHSPHLPWLRWTANRLRRPWRQIPARAWGRLRQILSR